MLHLMPKARDCLGTRRGSGGPAMLPGGARRAGSLFVPNEKGEMVPAQSYMADLQGGPPPPPGWP